ncbi:MAG: sensor histidine kinase, partial [Clostridia bacterium]
LWDMRYGENKVEYASLERVGSIVLACRVSAIIALMDYGLERPYACQVLSADGALITENKSALRRADDVLMRPIDDLGVALRISMEETQYFDSGFFLPAVLCTGLFFLFTQLMFSRLISASILKPIRALTAEMPHIQTLSSRQRLTPLHVEELDVIVDSANHMLDELAEASDKAVRAKTELLETQMRRNEAELYALQSQINPHFLFNTMQCMRALAVMQGASDVATIATAMAALLRYSITDGDRVRLADEAAIVRKYLFIIDVRYQHKIACTMEIPQELMETECIRMMIQPLVENAVMHGVSQRECGGKIGIHAFRTAMDVVIEVRDNGCGIEPKRLEEINATLQLNFSDAVTHRQIQSFGLYNIHRRIQLAYGKGYGLSLCSVPGDTILQLRLPFTQEKREKVQ